MRTLIKFWLCFSLLFVASTGVAGQKFKSLEDFARHTEGNIMLDMAWLEPVTFQGYLNAGSVTSHSSNPLYYDSGIGAAGPAIQLIAQAIGTKAARKRKYTRAQTQADQVLAEHADKISELSMENLYLHFKKMAEQNQYSVEVFSPKKKHREFFVKMDPVFALSQDKRSMMLRNKIQIHARKRPKKAIFKQQFVVVSDPVQVEDITGFWQQENENNLLHLSQHLFTQSVDLMLDEIAQKHVADAKQKTFRYEFGDKAVFERASLVKTQSQNGQCGRVSVITLGGDIMSLPLPELECSTELKG